MSIDCTRCRYFTGYDGVEELWTGCKYGDFKGHKKSCKHFKRPGRLMYLVMDNEFNNVALFFEEAHARNYTKQAEKECGFNKLLIIPQQVKIREVK